MPNDIARAVTDEAELVEQLVAQVVGFVYQKQRIAVVRAVETGGIEGAPGGIGAGVLPALDIGSDRFVVAGAGDRRVRQHSGADGQLRNGRVVSRKISAKVWLTSVSVTPRRITSSIFVLRR